MKKTVLRVLSLVLVLALCVPVFAACGNRNKEGQTTGNTQGTTQGVVNNQTTGNGTTNNGTTNNGTTNNGTTNNGTTNNGTTEGTTGNDGPIVPPVTDPVEQAKLDAIKNLLDSLTEGSENSEISAQLKATLLAQLWGNSTDLPFDVDLGTLGQAFLNSALKKELYNTLLVELVKLSAANDAEITFDPEGNAIYTIPVSQLSEMIAAWTNEENIAEYLTKLANKAAADPTFAFDLKAILGDILCTLSYVAANFGTTEDYPEGMEAPELLFKNEDGSFRICNDTDDAEILAALRAKQEELLTFAQNPTTNDFDTIVTIFVNNLNFLKDLEEDGYYTSWYAEGKGSDENGNTIFTYYGYSLFDEQMTAVLELLETYLESGDLTVLGDGFLKIAVLEMIHIITDEAFDSFEAYEAYMKEHEACITASGEALFALIVGMRDAKTYDEVLAVLNAFNSYTNDGCAVYVAHYPLEALQSMTMLYQLLLITINPAEDASIDDMGIHHMLAQMLCSYAGFEMTDDEGNATAEYTEFATLFYELFRSMVYGTAFDLPTHADALFTMFEIPLTYTEIVENSALYLIAKLNDYYDFAALLLDPNGPFPATESEYVKLITILDEEILSYLTLDADGKINENVINADRIKALIARLIDMLETDAGCPEELADALQNLLNGLLDGKQDAIAGFAAVIAEQLPFFAPVWVEEDEYSELVYLPVADADLTEEELAILAAYRADFVGVVAAWEALLYVTPENAEAANLAYIAAYCKLIETLADVSAAGYTVSNSELPPAEVLKIMAVVYAYPLAETPTEGNYAILETILDTMMGMTTEQMADSLAQMLGELFSFSDAENFATLAEELSTLIEQLIDTHLNTESTADAAKITADILLILGNNYDAINAEMWTQMFGSEVPADEEIRILGTVAMLAVLMMTDNVEDYNVYLKNMYLPEAVKDIDFNTFFAKVKSEETYLNALTVKSTDVKKIFDENATLVGETVTVVFTLDFDLLLASLKGDITLTINIAY